MEQEFKEALLITLTWDWAAVQKELLKPKMKESQTEMAAVYIYNWVKKAQAMFNLLRAITRLNDHHHDC